MKKFCKLMSVLLIMATLVSTFTMSASAASSSTVAESVSSRLPLVTYAMPLSGASRVYSYSDSSLNTKTTGYYIDTYIDQIVVTKISSDGKAVYVTYPSSSAPTGYRSRWFASDDILGIGTLNVRTYSASSNSTTYRMSTSSSVKSYGSIDKSDSCVCLGSHSIGGKTYYPTIYPISSGTYNQVSGVKYKLAFATSAPSSGASSSSTGSNNITVTVTINANSLESWCNQIKQTELGLVGFGKLVGNANNIWIEGNIISNRQVLSYKQIKVFIPESTYKAGPGLTGGKYITVNIPYKIQYTIHKHEYSSKVNSQYTGNFLVGLVNQQIVHTQTCSCGKAMVNTWTMPDLTFEKTTAGQTYTITSRVTSK